MDLTLKLKGSPNLRESKVISKVRNRIDAFQSNRKGIYVDTVDCPYILVPLHRFSQGVDTADISCTECPCHNEPKSMELTPFYTHL
jgi:hypothetical protein